MPDSADPSIHGLTDCASSADFSSRSDEAKIVSYMWYIHVTVRVNAADRLRDRLAHFLEQGTTTTAATTPASPLYPPPQDVDKIHNTGDIGGSSGTSSTSSPASHEGGGGGGAGAANETDDLTDYLVLQFFSRVMLEPLLNTAPVEEQTDGYARALAGIPARFREDFCRRLYCLLFSKYILEWPPGIAVPEPAPGSIAAAADSAGSASDIAVAKDDRSSVHSLKEEDDCDSKDDFMFQMDDFLTYDDGDGDEDEDEDEDDEEYDDIFDCEHHKHPVSPEEPASPAYQSTLGPSSPWADTSSLGYSPELARAAYFGTVSAPLPMHYLGDWGRRLGGGSRSSSSSSSSRDGGPARAAYSGAGRACARAHAGAGTGAGAGASASHDGRLLSPSRNPRQFSPVPPPHTTTTTTPLGLPASLARSAHIRGQQQHVSHTGSCCPCRVREAWSHGMGGQR